MEPRMRKLLRAACANTGDDVMSAVLAELPIHLDGDVELAETDGTELRVNPSVFEGMSGSGRHILLWRGAMHVVLQHPFRGRGRDPVAWRHSCEVFLNANFRRFLDLLPSPNPRYGPDGTQPGLTTEEIYEDVLSQHEGRPVVQRLDWQWRFRGARRDERWTDLALSKLRERADGLKLEDSLSLQRRALRGASSASTSRRGPRRRGRSRPPPARPP